MFAATSLGSIPIGIWLLCFGALTAARLFYFRYKKGFSKYNGPFFASFTDLWRMFDMYSNPNRAPMLDVHERYGEIVRLGPNLLSFAKPEAIKDIYGAGKAWNKVCAY